MYLALAHSRAGFPQDFTGLVVLKKNNWEHRTPFAYRAITCSGWPFQTIQLGKVLIYGSPPEGHSPQNAILLQHFLRHWLNEPLCHTL